MPRRVTPEERTGRRTFEGEDRDVDTDIVRHEVYEHRREGAELPQVNSQLSKSKLIAYRQAKASMGIKGYVYERKAGDHGR